MKTEEQELRKSVVIEGETPNCRSAREYREFQKEWIKGSCKEWVEGDKAIQCGKCHNPSCTNCFPKHRKCNRCNKPYLRHHEARYVVQHAGLL